ncbi:MAG: circadian clock KaiB family protein [Verrucomicrobiota bacterium]
MQDNKNKLKLRLYVAGVTSNSEKAAANIREVCEKELDGQYELEIIDIFEKPQLAEDERILATPTLIKELPPPLKRIIGDLSSVEKVLVGLDLRSSE